MTRNKGRKHKQKNNKKRSQPLPASSKADKQRPSHEMASSSGTETPKRRHGLTATEAYAKTTDVMVKLTFRHVSTRKDISANVTQEVTYTGPLATASKSKPLYTAAQVAPLVEKLVIHPRNKGKGKLPVRDFQAAAAGAAGTGNGKGKGKAEDNNDDEDEDDDHDEEEDDEDDDETDSEEESEDDDSEDEAEKLEIAKDALNPFGLTPDSLATWHSSRKALSNPTHFNVMMHRHEKYVKTISRRRRPPPEDSFAVRTRTKTTEVEQGLANLRMLLNECRRTENDEALACLARRVTGALEGLNGEGCGEENGEESDDGGDDETVRGDGDV